MPMIEEETGTWSSPSVAESAAEIFLDDGGPRRGCLEPLGMSGSTSQHFDFPEGGVQRFCDGENLESGVCVLPPRSPLSIISGGGGGGGGGVSLGLCRCVGASNSWLLPNDLNRHF